MVALCLLQGVPMSFPHAARFIYGTMLGGVLWPLKRGTPAQSAVSMLHMHVSGCSTANMLQNCISGFLDQAPRARRYFTRMN